MRAIITLLAIVVLLAIVGIATGFINLSGHSGSMPRIAVEGGSMPGVKADVGSIDLGEKKTTVDVPKVSTTQKTVNVPTIDVKKPN